MRGILLFYSQNERQGGLDSHPARYWYRQQKETVVPRRSLALQRSTLASKEAKHSGLFLEPEIREREGVPGNDAHQEFAEIGARRDLYDLVEDRPKPEGILRCIVIDANY